MGKFSDGCKAGWGGFGRVMNGESFFDAMNGVVDELEDVDNDCSIEDDEEYYLEDEEE